MPPNQALDQGRDARTDRTPQDQQLIVVQVPRTPLHHLQNMMRFGMHVLIERSTDHKDDMCGTGHTGGVCRCAQSAASHDVTQKLVGAVLTERHRATVD